MDVSGSGVGGSSVVAAVTAHLLAQLGPTEPARASVTFLGVQPLQVLRFGPDDTGRVRYATAGCARHPMGEPDALAADPVLGPRAELVLTVGAPVDGVLRTLAVLAATPSVEGLVLRPDALVDLSEPLWPGAPFTAVLLGESSVPGLPLPEPAEAVTFLAVTPVTSTEAAWVRLRGATALREAWDEAGIDVTDPGRRAVTL